MSEAEFTINTLGGVFIVSTRFLAACITTISPRAGVEVLAMALLSLAIVNLPELGILPNNLLSQANANGPSEFGNPQLYVCDLGGTNNKGSNSFL